MGRIFALVALGCAPGWRAGAQQDQSTWHVLIEPSFMHPAISHPIPGARTTLLVPGWLDGDELHYFSKAEWEAAGVTWDDFLARAARNATQKKVNGELVRNAKKVVVYGSITSDSPLTATVVLSPDFLKKFQDIFGPKILVALPNRYTVFVFPELASEYKDYSPMILNAYRDATYPVSLEVFEVSPRGLRAIGTFGE